MPFKYGEDAHTAARGGILNPRGRKRRFASSNTKLSSPYFVLPITWTHEFFFSIKQLIIIHLRSQIDAMQRAGLGKREIIFEDKRGDPVLEKSLKYITQSLHQQNGAFQLLGCLSGGSRVWELSVIPIGVDGYPVPLLKEVSKSSNLYIRPIRTDLNLKDALQNNHQQSNMYPKTTVEAKCRICNVEMELSAFTDHTATCCKMYNANSICTPTCQVNGNDNSINWDSIMQNCKPYLPTDLQGIYRKLLHNQVIFNLQSILF